MRTRDDSSLEKFLHINVTIPDLDFEKWQIYFTTTTSRAIAGLPEEASFKNAATIGRLISVQQLSLSSLHRTGKDPQSER